MEHYIEVNAKTRLGGNRVPMFLNALDVSMFYQSDSGYETEIRLRSGIDMTVYMPLYDFRERLEEALESLDKRILNAL